MKKLNNKILIVTLLVLVMAFVLSKMFRTPSLETNMDSDLLTVDTSKVTALKLYPVSNLRTEISFVKKGKTWSVRQDTVISRVEAYPFTNLLGSLAQLKPERKVSQKKEKWDDYKVSDSTGIHVVVLNEKEPLTDLWIGKESGNLTYLRKSTEDNVYAASGNLRTQADKDFNYWRDKSFLRLQPAEITKITFQYPADSSFVLEKKDKHWQIGNELADSAKVEDYLSKLRSKNLSAFADYFSPRTAADITITIESKAAAPTRIQAWRELGDKWILNSSLQPRVYFLEDSKLDLLRGKKIFLAVKKSNH
jgi:hypothetical protein